MSGFPTIDEIKRQQELFEADGRQALGVHVTAEQAVALRRELFSYYGQDPGAQLTALFGMEILSLDAKELLFE